MACCVAFPIPFCLSMHRGRLVDLYLESHQPSHTVPNRVTQPGLGEVHPLPNQGLRMLLHGVEHCIHAAQVQNQSQVEVLAGSIHQGRLVDAVVANSVYTQHAEWLLVAAIILAHCRIVLLAARLRMI